VPTLLEQMATLAELQEIPTDLWPDWSDPRVDAIIALAPGAQFYGADGLATVHVPTLLVESELDWYASEATANYAPYALLPANLKSHLVFKQADHGLYLNGCATMPGLLEQGFGFCADSVWDMDRAHDLINHFATAFLLAELKGDAEAAAALAPENVAFPGIQYETTVFE
jgi:predicted dienelactone hydrolase